MSILVFIAINLLLMGGLFAYGVYQFLQVEAKRKGRQLLARGDLTEADLRALLAAERHDEALTRLMLAADVDRFTAEAALIHLRAELKPAERGTAP